MTHYFQSRGPRQEAALKTHVRAPFPSPLTRVSSPLTSEPLALCPSAQALRGSLTS